MKEEWRAVKDFPKYQVSNMGRIRSFQSGREKFLKVNSEDYTFIKLYNDGTTRTTYLHVLILETFIPRESSKKEDVKFEVNHKNGKKSDNRLENLEYLTPSENVQHAYRTGLKVFTDLMRKKCSEANRGERCRFHKLTTEEVVEIKTLIKKGLNNDAIHAQFSFISKCTVGDIRKERTWRHVNIS